MDGPRPRLERILAQLSAAGRSGTHRLCEVATSVTAMSGAGIMLLAGDLPQGSLCATGKASAQIEDLQYTLGEGPGVDAHTLGRAVLEPDLASPDRPRWPAFVPAAVRAGARGVFGFPVRIGAARLGALNLYRDQPGPLSVDQHADALVMADVAARAVLALQADAPAGSIAAELESEANFQFVVHQASGMVSVQLGVGLAEALVRLRSFAFRSDRLVGDVARDVVALEAAFRRTVGPVMADGADVVFTGGACLHRRSCASLG